MGDIRQDQPLDDTEGHHKGTPGAVDEADDTEGHHKGTPG